MSQSVFQDQGESLTLRDLLDVAVLRELSEQIFHTYRVGVVISDANGEELLRVGTMSGAGQSLFQDLPKRGTKKEYAVDGAASFYGFPLMRDMDVIGVVAFGPAEASALPQIEFLARLFDLLLFSNLKRHLTNLAHLESITASYAELEVANRELQESFERLKEVDQMKSNFLAVVSHELRTPLTSVIGYAEMLLEGLAGDLTEQQSGYVRVIMEKGDQLLNLIREILNLSKIEAGKMTMGISPVDPREIISLAVETVRPLADKKSITLSSVVDSLVAPRMRLDRDKLLQIYNNLLSNALKFTPEGGTVTLRVSMSPLRAPGGQGDQEREGVYILSVVEDSGIGIPAEHLEKVFAKFYQVDNSSTRAYGGTGLGLTITKSFIEMHGGAIWVESEVEKGTRFSFTLDTQLPEAPMAGQVHEGT